MPFIYWLAWDPEVGSQVQAVDLMILAYELELRDWWIFDAISEPG